jgi:dienelactone hydrolase
VGILITCQQCGKQYDILPRFAGRKVKCRRCRSPIRVPGPLDRVRSQLPSLIQFDKDSPLPPESLPPTAEAVVHLVECAGCGRIHQLPEALPGKKSYFRCECGRKLRLPSPGRKSPAAEPPEPYGEPDEPDVGGGSPATASSDFASLEAELAGLGGPEAGPPLTPGSKLIPPLPPRAKPERGRKTKARTRPTTERRPIRWSWIALPLLIAILLPLALRFATALRTMNPDLSAARTLFPLSSVPVPPMPELPPARTLAPGVVFRAVTLGPGGGYPSTPGHGGTLWIYLPEGEHPARSLGCLLVAPAGTNLLTGADLGDEGPHPEHVPYVRAGFAVVSYSLDGPISGPPEQASNQDFARAYTAFKAAQGGLVNARNALEFVLARLPEVHPERIYAAGHSSAGTIALLLAEHEPRLRACVGYAPCVDLEARLAELVKDPAAPFVLPGIREFVIRSSPRTHEQALKCPLFLFHAIDDDNIPIEDTVGLADRLRQQGREVELVTVRQGGHYEPMLSEGIPRAIEWLKGRE